jgi:hypothetical protein
MSRDLDRADDGRRDSPVQAWDEKYPDGCIVSSDLLGPRWPQEGLYQRQLDTWVPVARDEQGLWPCVRCGVGSWWCIRRQPRACCTYCVRGSTHQDEAWGIAPGRPSQADVQKLALLEQVAEDDVRRLAAMSREEIEEQLWPR